MDTRHTSRCQRIIDLIDACLAEYGTPAQPALVPLPVRSTPRRSPR
jgi:hypothetical protein